MVKKRKNDTRIDPFSTFVETSNLDALLESATVGQEITMPAPSDANRTIRLTCKIIKNADIATSTQVFAKNRRVQSLLNEQSVADILPAIKADQRNQHPALTWSKEGVELVLAGSRRRKACILAGADYIVLSSDDFNEEDAKILAISSDQYIAPSLWELGQAYSQTKMDLIAVGKKGSYREIAEIEGVSHTAIADALKAFEKLPSEVIALYPTANFVGREVAKKLIASLEHDQDAFMRRVSDTQTLLADIRQDSDDKTAIAITKSLVEQPKAIKNRASLNFNNDYIVGHRNEKTGDLVIKIDNRVLTDKRFEQLEKLLTHFN
ncbi:chromosome partitioning protein, ParB family [Pseudoalteromonas ulvae UL12]|uniref:Transcriptional regulator n=1 Tax=Pseudoalteromonas ulvae TaxID=107327 RepID=A0A244CRE4_PSEDV|nr:transcriptional regulator [Pseudoalteromonas ulvae]MBE0365431.1 chromosome partitioning protein, ParB family [Pseudoalteromonas ulvae UL12]OUL58056.1 transcriptional regulator [Pseudoalteromonas ulvae]